MMQAVRKICVPVGLILTFAATAHRARWFDRAAGRFRNIVEREDQANAATTGGQSSAKGNLDIVEIEIYEPVKPAR